MAAPGSSHHTTSSNWRQLVTSLYPDALTRTYCVPPVHFNRVPYVRDVVPGTGHSALVLPSPSAAARVHIVVNPSQQPVPPTQYSLWTQEADPEAVPRRVQDSDLHDDCAQNHVMQNLQALGDSRQEPMFILSQLQFGSYLNQPAYAAAAAQLPRPIQLAPRYREGEFDVLLIHRQHGVLIGELKAVGRHQAAGKNPQPPADADVAKRVKKAVKQLDKSERVVRHLVSDVAPGLTVRKTLFLPYVSSQQLENVLDNDPPLQRAVCRSLGAANAAEAVQLCCCSDQLSPPASYWHVTPAVLSQLSTWWTQRMACTVDSVLTDDLYLDILARFVGPATSVCVPCHTGGMRVEVRTAGQAVAELGRRLALLVLTLQQVDLMNRDPPRVYITGPPGTGKTVVLVLQGLRWLLQGHDVHVLSVEHITRAASRMVAEQLTLSLRADPTSRPGPATVHLHRYDFVNREADVEQAVSDLVARVTDGRLHVLIDEADFNSSLKSSPRLTSLLSRLTSRVPHLYLWAAGVFHTDTPPTLQPERLTVPLRCAPAVLREVATALGRARNVHQYSHSGLPAPGDGQRVTWLQHSGHDHTGRWPSDCLACGKRVAAELRHLGVGGSNVATSPAPLSYRDVLILTRSSELKDDVMDDAGQVTSPASGFVRGLRGEGLPVCVIGKQEWRHNRTRVENDVEDLAVAATDRVTVADWGWVQGLERRVVVVLQDRNKADDDQGRSEEVTDLNDRLQAVSRCTTQLVMVRLPPATHTTTTTTATTSATAASSSTTTTTATTTTNTNT